jgi:hypothetical protein
MGRSAEGTLRGLNLFFAVPRTYVLGEYRSSLPGGCMVARAAFHPQWLLRQRELRSTGRIKDPSPH